MLVVGLTGGIGSGKTTIAKHFEKLGVSVYYSDDRAKELMINSEKLRSQLIEEFGDKVYNSQGLNREYLASIVFNNKESLSKLNSLVHPIVAQDFYDWKKNKSGDVVIKEAAILFESGAYKSCDINISIYSDVKKRIARVVKRDSVTKQQVQARISNQWSDEKRNLMADIVLENNDIEQISSKVEKLLIKLKDINKKEA